MKCFSQIHFSFSTWSHIFETGNSRSGTTRGKLRVFSHCPPLCFEDSTSWPIPGKSLKPYVSVEDFSEGFSQRRQSLGYKWQICSGNRSLPQIAPSSLGTPPHSENALWPTGLRPASFPQACSAPQASPLALFPEPAVQEPCLFFSMFLTTYMLFFFIQEFIGMLSLPLTLFQKILESLSLYNWSAAHKNGTKMAPKWHHASCEACVFDI